MLNYARYASLATLATLQAGELVLIELLHIPARE
jgi:hypothetical protein